MVRFLSAFGPTHRSGRYATRVANITNGTGLANGYRLVGDDGNNQTVKSGSHVDVLTANQGTC